MIKNRANAFTLIEMMLVMAILTCIVALIGVNTYKAVQKERFRTAVDVVLSKLQMAQDLMLVLKTEVRVKLEQVPKKGLLCTLEMEEEPSILMKKLMKKNGEIAEIGSFYFEDEDGRRYSEKCILTFSSGGTKMSKGTLHLFKNNVDNVHEALVLEGRPTPIGRKTKLTLTSHEKLYPIREVQDLLLEKKPESSTEAPVPAA